MTLAQEERHEVHTQLAAAGMDVALSPERLFKNAQRGGMAKTTESGIKNAALYLADLGYVEQVKDDVTNVTLYRITAKGIQHAEDTGLI